MILQPEEGRETFFARSYLRVVALFWNSKREQEQDGRRDPADWPGGIGTGGA